MSFDSHGRLSRHSANHAANRSQDGSRGDFHWDSDGGWWMGLVGDSAGDLQRDMRAFSEGDLRTDSCCGCQSDSRGDSCRDSEADLRRDLRRDLRAVSDRGLRGESRRQRRLRKRASGTDIGWPRGRKSKAGRQEPKSRAGDVGSAERRTESPMSIPGNFQGSGENPVRVASTGR
jgi:hypothetical protein